MTLRLHPEDDRNGNRRRAVRGDGSPLASFLCPVCRHDVLVEDRACDHLLLVRDRYGEIFCRDRRVRELQRAAEDEVGERGERAILRLCERLGPGVILYELLDAPGTRGTRTSTLFVVDVGRAPGASGD